MAGGKSTTPSSHPSSEGLQLAIRDGVQNELDRRGVGGSGGGNDRLGKLEREVSVIQSTMVTRESLHIEMNNLKLELARLPLTLIKYIGGVIAVVASVATAVWKFIA